MGHPALIRALTPAQRNPLTLYLAALAPGSRPTMVSSLRRLCEQFFDGADPARVPWHELRFEHVAAIRNWMTEPGPAGGGYSTATANRILCCVRGILLHARRLGLMTETDYAAAAAVASFRGHRLAAGRSLGPGELRALFAACDLSTTIGARDSAVLAVLYGCGLRRAELCALDRSDFHPPDELRVLGKGNKERLVYLPPKACGALVRWLAVRGDQPGPLFVPTGRRGRKLELRRLSNSALWGVLQRVGRQACVAPFTPHDMRRTFVGDMLDAGADLATVQALAGHSSPTTTARYDRRGERAKAKAAQLIHIPMDEPEPEPEPEQGPGSSSAEPG